jgi:hypothetical protein
MKRNVGPVDRGVRFVLGTVMAVAAFFVGALWLKLLLSVLAGVALFTGLTGVCLLYSPFGVNTCPVRGKDPGPEKPR